jgi:membrane associated rhomboid family serine protease
MKIPIRNQRENILTGVFLLAIPCLLTLIHILIPPASRSLFVFDHSQFRIYTLWTSGFVHIDWNHLQNNLLGYGGAVIPLWMLAHHWETEKGLRHTIAVFLTGLPVAVSLLDYAAFKYILQATEKTATRGFSGITAALLGLVLVTATREVYLATSDWRKPVNYAFTIILLCLGGILFLNGTGSLILYGAILGGVTLVGSSFIPRTAISEPGEFRVKIIEQVESVLFVFYSSLIVIFFVPRLFPLDWIGENTVTNIFGHFFGFCLGILVGGMFLAQYREWQISWE